MPRARVPDDDAVRFGAIVTRLRTERGWTLADLSRLSGMNATWLGVLERGGNMPGLATIFKLAEVFGVEAAELVRAVDQARRSLP
ncbi:MAG TPA: helix-turn-helix transcriptional regulator [Thermoanaerobaculia bacterium]